MDKEISLDKKDFITFAKEAIGQKPLEIKFKKLDDKAVVPTYAHYGDVGMDMTAISVEYNELMDVYIYHTGLAFESDYHYGQFLFPRSSNRKTDCYLSNSVGIIDTALYRGEIIFCYKSRTSTYDRANTIGLKAFMNALAEGKDAIEAKCEYTLAKNRVYEMTKNLEFAPYKIGDKIGQMVVLPYPDVNLIECYELKESVRGDKGFGSTDEKK
jgi:dUTP pyrophosphatase